jgi:hypothetical protein
MRWYTLPLVSLALALSLSLPASAQQAPGGGGGGGLRGMLQQLQENVQNNGGNMQDLIQNFRQQAQDGTLNPQALVQQLQDNGIINQDMIDNLQNLRQNYQQNRQTNQQTYQQYYQNGGVTPNALQVRLGAADDEWAVLAPKIQKVIDLTNDLAQSSGDYSAYVNITAVPRQNQAAATVAATALAELNVLLANEGSPASDIKIKLTALRDAKKKVQADLITARAELVSLVTYRQECILVTLAILI